jgi:uncharacterized protein
MIIRFQRILFFTVLGLFSCNLFSQTIFDVVRKGDIQVLQQLYTLKPDTINSINENGFTPLIIAVYRYQNEAAKFLLEHGASVNVNSPEGPALLAAVYKNNTEMVEALIKHKANLDLTNEEGVTALMFAAMNNNLKLVNLLLTNGATKNQVSKSGHSAFSYAGMYNFTDIQQALSK